MGLHTKFILFSVLLAATSAMSPHSNAKESKALSYKEKYDKVDDIAYYFSEPPTQNITEFIEFAKIAVLKPYELTDDTGIAAKRAVEAVKKYAPEHPDLMEIERIYYARLKKLEQQFLEDSNKKGKDKFDGLHNLYLLYSRYYLEDTKGHNPEKAIQYLDRSCNRGSVFGCKVAGNNYFFGRAIVEQDFTRALSYYYSALAADPYWQEIDGEYARSYSTAMREIRMNLALATIYTANDRSLLSNAIAHIGTYHTDYSSKEDLIRLAARRLVIADEGNKQEALYALIKDIKKGRYGYLPMQEKGISELMTQILNAG